MNRRYPGGKRGFSRLRRVEGVQGFKILVVRLAGPEQPHRRRRAPPTHFALLFKQKNYLQADYTAPQNNTRMIAQSLSAAPSPLFRPSHAARDTPGGPKRDFFIALLRGRLTLRHPSDISVSIAASSGLSGTQKGFRQPAWWQNFLRPCLTGASAPAALSALCHWGFDSCAPVSYSKGGENLFSKPSRRYVRFV